VASIKDIAARANVSIGTVDRVLHDRGRVSAETRSRVQRIVKDLGYRPNIHARNLSLDKMFRFGVLMPRLSQDSDYWRIPAKGIDKAGRELATYKVDIQSYPFDRYSEKSFERAFHRAVLEKPDGLLIAPVLPHVAERLVRTIPKEIPFVFFDSTVPGIDCLSFIGQDPYQSGLLAARLMLKVIRGEGPIAIVKVTPGDFHIDERIRGFLNGISGTSRRPAQVYEVDSHGGEGAFVKAAERILHENKSLGGVFVSNAWTHSVARHIHAHRHGRSVSIIGYDLVSRNIASLEQGIIDFLISQRPEMQGYEGIYCLYEQIVLREAVQRRIMVPIDILTKDNIKYYQG
jgi:LacI family transcriptional regulator